MCGYSFRFVKGGSRRPTRTRIRIAGVVAAIVLLLTGVFVSLRVTPSRVALEEETFTLKCMPANAAASMLRPILVRTGTISLSMRIPTALTVAGTPDQLRQARSILAEQDVPGSASCPQR